MHFVWVNGISMHMSAMLSPALFAVTCIFVAVDDVTGRSSVTHTTYRGAQDLGRPPDPEVENRSNVRLSFDQHSDSELNNGTILMPVPDTAARMAVYLINDSYREYLFNKYPNRSYSDIRRVITMNPECRNFEFIVSFVLVGITCLFGFIGNVLSILTLRRDSIKSVTTFLLSALAVADSTFLVPAVFVSMIPTYCEYHQHCVERLVHAIPTFEQYGLVIMSTCHTCTVYMTVLVAIHRYLWVCRLHLAQRLSGLRRVKIQVAAVPFCALLYNSPRILEYEIIHYTWNDTLSSDSTNLRKETTKVPGEIGSNRIFQIGYKNLLFFIIMYIIPLTILALVSMNLIKTLKQRRATLQRIGSTSSNASQGRRDDNITFVLIIIIAAFVICQTPMIVQRIMLAMSGPNPRTDDVSCGAVYFYFEHIADYMVLLNSSTNFVIYILFSPHFRHTLMSEVLCKHSRSRNNGIRLASMRTRKLPSDERNAMALMEMLPNNNNALAMNVLNGHVTGNGHRIGQQTSPDGAEIKWLLPPEVNDKSGNGSNFLSNSSQTTHQELLSASHEDLRNKDGEETDIKRRHTLDNPSMVFHDREDQESKNVQIPEIAFEQASSQTESS